MGFPRETNSSMVTWCIFWSSITHKGKKIRRHGHITNRHQLKMYTVIFKSRHALEQYPEIKFRVRQSVRWLEHIPCLHECSRKFESNLCKLSDSRSSRPEVFCKRGVLRNFAKLTGKHLCQRLFFNKVVVLCPATLLKKNFWHSRFPLNFLKFLGTPFFIEHIR